MKLPRVLSAALCTAALATLASCTWHEPPPTPSVPRGHVSWERIQECLSAMMRAPMPVHYMMPVGEAVKVLGEPHGQLTEMRVLKAFAPARGARAYFWHFHRATLYIVFDRKARLVENVIVVDDMTHMGTEMLLTREEILSARLKVGMTAADVYRIMGKPDRIETLYVGDKKRADRFWYEPAGKFAAPICIDIDLATLEVIFVSTAPMEDTGPPEIK